MVVIVSGLTAGIASLIGLNHETKQFKKERISQHINVEDNPESGNKIEH